MALRRYVRSPVIRGGRQLGTSLVPSIIWRAVRSGEVETKRHVMQGEERLDIIAGELYGDASLWWIIAAASGIGWGMQCPPGTVLDIPTKIEQITRLVG
jgi:hypothetical protein